MNLICDTNIWYNISNGEINAQELIQKGYNLIANPINVIEIIANKRYDNNFKCKVIDSILRYSKNFRTKLPEQYIANTYGYSLKIEFIDFKELLIEYKNLIEDRKVKLEYYKYILNIQKQKNKMYNNFSSDISYVVEKFLPGFEEKRKQGKAIHLKKNEIQKIQKKKTYILFETFLTLHIKFLNTDYNKIKYIHKKICKLYYEKYTKYIKHNNDDIYSFLQYTFPNYNKENDIYGKLKVYFNAYFFFILEILSTKSNEPNDFGDLELLVYVNENNKLFTKEKKWIKIIKNSGMEEFIFEK